MPSFLTQESSAGTVTRPRRCGPDSWQGGRWMIAVVALAAVLLQNLPQALCYCSAIGASLA